VHGLNGCSEGDAKLSQKGLLLIKAAFSVLGDLGSSSTDWCGWREHAKQEALTDVCDFGLDVIRLCAARSITHHRMTESPVAYPALITTLSAMISA
jgi:hypothetical protein